LDEAVIRYYRRMLKAGFEHAGSLRDPSIMLDSVGEGIRFCGGHPADYMHVYIRVRNSRVDDIKYLCNCDPAANVVVEVLCNLVKGRTLEEVSGTTEEMFYHAVGSRSEEVRKKTRGILELLGRGLTRYRTASQAGFTA